MDADNMKGEVVIKAPVVHGNGAHIVVPRRWLGWVVRCEVVRRNKEHKAQDEAQEVKRPAVPCQ